MKKRLIGFSRVSYYSQINFHQRGERVVNYLDISGAELSISNWPFEQMKGGRGGVGQFLKLSS